MRSLAALLALALAGLPVLTGPSWAIGGLGAVTAAVCGAGIARFSIRAVRIGATLALVEYALACWASPAPPDVVTALAVGVALCLLLDVVELTARFRGAAVDPAVLRRQLRAWLGLAATTGAGGLLLALATGHAALPLSAPLAPAVAALGAIGTIVGLLRSLPRDAERRRHDCRGRLVGSRERGHW